MNDYFVNVKHNTPELAGSTPFRFTINEEIFAFFSTGYFPLSLLLLEESGEEEESVEVSHGKYFGENVRRAVNLLSR